VEREPLGGNGTTDNEPTQRRWLSYEGAAAEVGVKHDTIRNWVRFNGLPCVKVGLVTRIDRADLEAFLAARKRGFRVNIPDDPPELNPRAARALLRLLRDLSGVYDDDETSRRAVPPVPLSDGTAPTVPYGDEAAR
jgi:excisionase family DNA binding protein